MERRKGPFSRDSAEFPLGPLFVAHHLHSDARSCGVDGGCIELRAAYAARADVLEQDARAAVSKLIAHVAQDAGFEGTRRRALDRFEGLVDMCMSCGTNRSCHDAAVQLHAI